MSTYSPDLRIELITTGDQAGTWGATTNTNMAYVVEQAIAGYVSVSVISANQALTYLNGGSSTAALNQSVHASLALTTTTGANFAVYAPPASKQYTIYNASAYTATIYNSTVIGNTTAAGTGVAVPAGKTVAVWSDGTNFSLQNTSTPTASSGTNDTTIASTAFVQQALQAAFQALHPVGSVYINATDNTNPATLFGFGTWAAFGAGRVPVGFDSSNALFNTAEETGGSYDAIVVSHTHTGTTGNQSANHTHTFSATTSSAGAHQHAGDWPNDCTSASYAFGTSTAAPSSVFCDTNGTVSYSALTNSAGSHSHTVSGTSGSNSVDHTHSFTTASSGSSGTNANVQPYITVYMWKRTA